MNTDSISNQLTTADTKGILHLLLGITAEGSGNKYMKSPLREDNNASFSINLDTGLWKDHGSDESGDIVNLVERKVKKYNTEAIKWIKYHSSLSSALYEAPKSNGSQSKKADEHFWNSQHKREMKQAQQRLENEPQHPAVKQANEYDCL